MVIPPTADAPPDLPGLGSVDHLGIAVADLDDAIAFYTQVLGLRLTHQEDNGEQGVREAMLESDRPGQAQIQLLAPIASSSPVAAFLARRGPGLHHVAYAVADLAASSAILRRRGVRLIYDAPRAGTRGSLINFLHPTATGGVLIELVEQARDDQPRG
jgi:methylmalonyl-CoA/ethylmalonyl-CoA epimerase